ncbi:MAG TPA: [FeFe] hydrogenase H-cluster radical SAM maturase HydE [Firmicutes bacterium]|nr:[FeFe] hydrogenase H-cluster radical SAM maturase HydE [Bacillota bacterium]
MRSQFLEAIETAESWLDQLKGGPGLSPTCPLGDHHIKALLSACDQEEINTLIETADYARKVFMGNQVHLRGIIEFSNHCARNCWYCGLRRDNTCLRRYRMPLRDIVAAAREGAKLGFKTIVLQSGDDLWYSASMIRQMVESIKQEVDVAITLSIGEREFSEYEEMRAAGADRFLLKHETADPDLYARLHPGMTLDGRVERLKYLHRLGFQVGSGNIVGLPGQTIDVLARDICLMRDLDVEMAGIGPFIPHPATPLAGYPPGDMMTVLKVLATCRIVMPWAHLPATTACGTLDPNGRQKALRAGANVIMPDITPAEYKALYEIYPGKNRVDIDAARGYQLAVEMIISLGREVGQGYGHSSRHRPAPAA